MDTSIKSRIKRAFTDTEWFAWKRQVPVGIISGVLAFSWLRQQGIQKDLTEQVVISVSIIIAAIIIVPLFEFVYNLIKAPIRTAREQIEKLEKELDAKKAEVLQLTDSRRAPELTFEPGLFQEGLETPQGARVGLSLIAELRITNRSKFTVSLSTTEIRYRDEFTNNAFRLIGRWIDGPFLMNKNSAVMPVELEPEQTRRLGIAVKPQLTDTWYALDNQSPFEGYCIEGYELIGPVSIVVELKGPRETVTRRFQLKEENGVPAFDEIR